MAIYDREKPKDYTHVACCGTCGLRRLVRELAPAPRNDHTQIKKHKVCEYHGCRVEPTGHCSQYQPKPEQA
jgi:hypothetical protein